MVYLGSIVVAEVVVEVDSELVCVIRSGQITLLSTYPKKRVQALFSSIHDKVKERL